jgi:hypothetical protein
MLVASMAVPGLRGFLGFALPGPIGYGCAALGIGGAVALSRALPEPGSPEIGVPTPTTGSADVADAD